MKTSIYLWVVASILCVAHQSVAHSSPPRLADFVSWQVLQDIAHRSYDRVISFYNQHPTATKTVIALALVHYVYKTYCPVASRCKQCSEKDLTLPNQEKKI